MSPAEQLATALERDDATLALRASDAARIQGIRARQASALIAAARTALEQARSFLRAPSSGFYPVPAPDPRKEPDDA